MTALTGIAFTVLKSLITEAIFKRLVLIALKALVKSTKNKLDDELVAPVAKALGIKA